MATKKLCSALPVDFLLNSAAERQTARGHSPACKGSRKQHKRYWGQVWKQQRATWQTNTTTSRSGSRRSARHPHCLMSAMPMALPISCKGEEQSQAVKITELSKLQITALTVQSSQIPGKERVSLYPKENKLYKDHNRYNRAEQVSEGQSKHSAGQNDCHSAGGQEAEVQVLPKVQQKLPSF